MKRTTRLGIGFAAAFAVTRTFGGTPVFDGFPFFDFTDEFYLENGVDPSLIFDRVEAGSPIGVADESPDDDVYRDVRVLLTIPGWDHSGDPLYLSVFGEFGPEAFTDDEAGREARAIADDFPLYIFPRADGDQFSPFRKRQNDIVPLNNGYFSGDPLGLWVLIFVRYTDEAFDTPEGREALDELARENGLDLDGTPIVKTEGDLLDLEEDGFVEFLLRPLDNSRGGRWSVCPVLKDPRDGAIAPDAFLAAAVDDAGNSAPNELELVCEFEALQTTGDWADEPCDSQDDNSNDDGSGNGGDIREVVMNYGRTGPAGMAGDVNRDGRVDAADVRDLLDSLP